MHHSIVIDLEIPFSSPCHAGSGEGSLVIDRLIQKDTRQCPFIPAATLKGVIRQSCEKLSRTLKFAPPSDPHQRNLSKGGGFVPFDRMASPVDRLFGTNFEPGGLFFRKAYPVDKKNWKEEDFQARTRTSRHRILGTVKEKQLFSTQYTPPCRFETRINGNHRDLAIFDKEFPPYAYCLLIAGILSVDRMGGDKSTGAGWLEQGLIIRRALINGEKVEMDDVFELLNPEDYQEMRGES